MHAAPTHHGPIKIEDVVDWPKVIKKYQALQGVDDAQDTTDIDRMDDGGAMDMLNDTNDHKDDGPAV